MITNKQFEDFIKKLKRIIASNVSEKRKIIELGKIICIIDNLVKEVYHSQGKKDEDVCANCGKRIFDINKRICGESWDYCICKKFKKKEQER